LNQSSPEPVKPVQQDSSGFYGDRARRRERLRWAAWTAWLVFTVAAGMVLYFGFSGADTGIGVSRVMWGAALLCLAGYAPLGALAEWRCRRAAGHLPSGWQEGAAQLPSWPGLHERESGLRVRCGHRALRLWGLALGLGVSGYLMQRLADQAGVLHALDVILALTPAACATLFSLLWGPSGWELRVEERTSRATLILWKALGRSEFSTLSLPTVQRISLEGSSATGWHMIIAGTKDSDWDLKLPGIWPEKLSRALVARLSRLSGVRIEEGTVSSSEDSGASDNRAQDMESGAQGDGQSSVAQKQSAPKSSGEAGE